MRTIGASWLIAVREADLGLARLWSLLRTGEWQVRSTDATDTELSAIIERSAHHRPLSLLGLDITEQVLTGTPSKIIACDRGVQPSSVSCAVRGILGRMGMRCHVKTVPLIVSYALYAHRNGVLVACHFEIESDHIRITVARPTLPPELPPAERAVLTDALAGKTHTQIAVSRRRSMRTVRNQVHDAREKLGVTDHGAALQRLFETVSHS